MRLLLSLLLCLNAAAQIPLPIVSSKRIVAAGGTDSNVAHDAATESTTWTTTPDPFTFSHTPSGTPKGVIVFIASAGSSADVISGVTYGGVSMSRVQLATDTAGEPGTSYAYFLGSSIPTGGQTVSIDHTATGTTKYSVCVTVTASADTSVAASGVVQEDAANPQVALDSGVDTALRYAFVYSGLPNVPDLTLLSDHTAVHDLDGGAAVVVTGRQTARSSGSFTVGWTAASDDVAFVAVAVK